jgi:hypothetical protein
MRGFFTPKPKKPSPDEFWRDYEEKTGEKVIARCLGQYVSGWDGFNNSSKNPLWGLIIATSGGFRFHHFPQQSWLTALSSIGGNYEPPKEKTIFIPGEKIISAVLHRETKWYKKIFSPITPRLVIRYHDETGNEKELLLNADFNTNGLTEALTSYGKE